MKFILAAIRFDILVSDDLGVGATLIVVLLQTVHTVQLPLSLPTLTGTQTALTTLLAALTIQNLQLLYFLTPVFRHINHHLSIRNLHLLRCNQWYSFFIDIPHLFFGGGVEILQEEGIEVTKAEREYDLGGGVGVEVVPSHEEEDDGRYEEGGRNGHEYVVPVGTIWLELQGIQEEIDDVDAR